MLLITSINSQNLLFQIKKALRQWRQTSLFNLNRHPWNKNRIKGLTYYPSSPGDTNKSKFQDLKRKGMEITRSVQLKARGNLAHTSKRWRLVRLAFRNWKLRQPLKMEVLLESLIGRNFAIVPNYKTITKLVSIASAQRKNKMSP